MYIRSQQPEFSLDDRSKRLKWVALCIFLVLILRLFFLQIWHGNQYRQMAENNRIRLIKTRTPRGIIYDCNNVPLATNRRVFSIFFDPVVTNKEEREDSYNKLIRILRNRNANYADELARKGNIYQRMQPRKIAQDVDYSVVAAVREQSLDLPGVYVKDEFIRYYPLYEGGAHLLGYLRGITVDELQEPEYEEYDLSDVVGRDGLERVYEKQLRGQAGGWQIEVDALGRKKRDLGELPSIPGSNLVLNVDARLQKKAVDLLSGKRGAIVAMDPNTGGIKALVSEPSYDPNLLSGYITHSQWAKIANDPGRPFNNRAISGTYPPGSIFKLITALAGLESGKITPNTTFVCGGSYRLGKWTFKCTHTHGAVNLNRAIGLSCNVYFYNVAQKVGIEKLLYLAAQFGFGEKTGIDLQKERRGFLPTREWKKKNRREGWYLGDTVQLGIGQGFLLASPIQIMNVVSTIANGGTVYKPMVVRQVEDGGGKILQKFQPVALHKIQLNPDQLNLVRKGMWTVVNGAGTATNARIPGLELAGKTGTAQSGTGGKDIAWFCAYGPYEKPGLTVLAIVEEGGYGAVAAAPLVRDMFREWDLIRKGKAESPMSVIQPRRIPGATPLELDTTANVLLGQDSTAPATEVVNPVQPTPTSPVSKKEEPVKPPVSTEKSEGATLETLPGD